MFDDTRTERRFPFAQMSWTWILHFNDKWMHNAQATKPMLTLKPSAYPPSRICGLFESLVTPNTSGIKSPLKLKMENNVSTISVPSQSLQEFKLPVLKLFYTSTFSHWAMKNSQLWVRSEFWLLSELLVAAKVCQHFTLCLCFGFPDLLPPPLLFSISHCERDICSFW